jgi:hypothetical protein
VAAALLAFNNALAVSLFSLVPGTNVGYPALVLGILGILFTAAAIRSVLSSRSTRNQQLRQIGLIGLLLLIFGTELVAGITVLAEPASSVSLQAIGYALITSMIVGNRPGVGTGRGQGYRPDCLNRRADRPRARTASGR